MQEKSIGKCSSASRLQRLRIKKQCRWADLAEELGLSEAMVYAVSAGKKSLSEKAIYRLEELEKAAGIEPLRVSVDTPVIITGPPPDYGLVSHSERHGRELDEINEELKKIKAAAEASQQVFSKAISALESRANQILLDQAHLERLKVSPSRTSPHRAEKLPKQLTEAQEIALKASRTP